MRKTITLLLLMACATLGMQAQKKVYDESLDAMEQIKTATALARESGRHVLCQVGGNWCPWCLRFAEFATTDSVIAPLLDKHYVYVHINYSKANKTLEAMKFLGNPGRFGYPVFVVLDTNGTPIHIQESASLEEGKGYNRKRTEKFLLQWTKAAVEAEPQ